MDNSTILRRLQIIKDLQGELNTLNEMFEDTLDNDPQYQKIQEKVEEIKEDAKVQKELIQAKVLDRASVKAIKDDIKEKKEEIRDNKEILSQELVDYYRQTGALEIEDEEGNVKKLKFSVKLTN